MRFLRARLGTYRPLGSKGVALLMAMVAMTMLLFIAQEISHDVTVEYVVNSQSITRLQAYWNARAGAEISLLRIKLYQKAQQKFGSMPFASQLNLIWSFPFAWPPPLPSEISSVDQEMLQKKIKESFLEGSYFTTISEESSKIDLNDLGSPSKALRERAEQRLKGLFQQKVESDESWAREFRDFDFNSLVNNIADWVDADTESKNGGDESIYYKNPDLPPNRFFRSVSELRLVAGMTEEMLALVEPRVTIYGSRSINPNTADKESLMAIDETMTEEIVSKVIEQRQENPFTDEKQFWSFVLAIDNKASKAQSAGAPLSFQSAQSFLIKSTGSVSSVNREVEILVWDFTQPAKTLAEALRKESATGGGGDSNTATGDPNKEGSTSTGAGGGNNNQPKGSSSSSNQSVKLPKGPPRIVEWKEK